MNRLPQSYLNRANRLLDMQGFKEGSEAIPIEVAYVRPPPALGEAQSHPSAQQYILRMMLRSDKLPLAIPEELQWLEPTILRLDAFQKSHGLLNPFVYATVRHGIVRSETDDAWHVDGFSMRVPHVPEQNYIYSSCFPTETLIANWDIPAGFDPLKHNIHTFFQDYEQGGIGPFVSPATTQRPALKTLEPNVIYAIDPYCVHRRPAFAAPVFRTFWRISFIPIEIEDDTCTQNPLSPPKVYGREDVRTMLTAWKPLVERRSPC